MIENKQMSFDEMIEAAKKVRLQCFEMALHAGNEGAHMGAALSSAEILVALYHRIMNIDPADTRCENRDRFILSKGHGAQALYSVLIQLGIIPESSLGTFKDQGSLLTGHPSMNLDIGVEFSTGSLGQGLSLAVGSCLGMTRKGNNNSRVYVLMGDGECDEGSVWEAAMAASHYQLSRITVIIDINGLQYDGTTEDTLSLGSFSDKWAAFGWDVFEVDGHDLKALCSTFESINGRIDPKKPAVVLAKTVKGKGVSYMEHERSWHFGRVTQALYDQAIKEIEAM